MILDRVVYVDMDGVVADFGGALLERFGITFDTAPKGKVWGKIMRYNDNVEDWFYSLPLMSDAEALWAFVTEHFEQVEILTASGTSPRDAPGQKRAWIGEKFGYDVKVNVVGSASEKAAFVVGHAVPPILIDDRNRSIGPFVKAGGIGILHTSAVETINTLEAMMKGWE